MKFAANIHYMFTEHAFLDRFAAAARAGFEGVEFPMPYGYPKETLAALLQEHGLTQTVFVLPSGDWDKGDRGIAIFPERQEEFCRGIDIAIDYAQALDCKMINCVPGMTQDKSRFGIFTDTLVSNLQYAAQRLGEAGIKLLIEPANSKDFPGYFLETTTQAMALIEAVGSDNLFIEYDVYHMQIMEGDIANTFRRLQERIAYIQIADVPGRHEPGTGELNYPFLLRRFEELGYRGWVGAEYLPLGGTEAGLGWLDRV